MADLAAKAFQQKAFAFTANSNICGCLNSGKTRPHCHPAPRQSTFRTSTGWVSSPTISHVVRSNSSALCSRLRATQRDEQPSPSHLSTTNNPTDTTNTPISLSTSTTQPSSSQLDSTNKLNTYETSGHYITQQPASLSRVLLTGVQMQPARAARVGGSGAGPRLPSIPSKWVILVSILAAAVAITRARLKAVRDCGACRGYGVQRCKICQGKGGIEWEGKMAHREPCPLCLGRRFVRCSCCGGGPFARNLFMHKNKTGEALLQQLQQFGTGSSGTSSGQPRRSLFGRLTTTQDQETIDKSDELAEQIMMD